MKPQAAFGHFVGSACNVAPKAESSSIRYAKQFILDPQESETKLHILVKGINIC